MANPNNNLDELMKNPNAAGLLKNKEALMGLVRSPDTQKLMQLLNQQAGSGLKGAAEAAAKGDTSQLVGLMSQLMNSSEGAAVVNRLNKNMPKK